MHRRAPNAMPKSLSRARRWPNLQIPATSPQESRPRRNPYASPELAPTPCEKTNFANRLPGRWAGRSMPSIADHIVPRRRWGIGVLLGSGVLVSFLDRVSLSAAAPQFLRSLVLGPWRWASSSARSSGPTPRSGPLGLSSIAWESPGSAGGALSYGPRHPHTALSVVSPGILAARACSASPRRPPSPWCPKRPAIGSLGGSGRGPPPSSMRGQFSSVIGVPWSRLWLCGSAGAGDLSSLRRSASPTSWHSTCFIGTQAPTRSEPAEERIHSLRRECARGTTGDGHPGMLGYLLLSRSLGSCDWFRGLWLFLLPFP